MGLTGAGAGRAGRRVPGRGGPADWVPAGRRARAALGRIPSRLRGILAARTVRGVVHVAVGARLARGVRIAVSPGAQLLVGSGCRVGRRVRLEALGGAIELAGGCQIGERTRLVARGGSIELAQGVALGPGCTLIAHAGIAIGARSVLGDGVSVIDFEPALGDSERPIRTQGVRAAAVRLGPRVLVGPRAAIGPGASLPAGMQVAAGMLTGRMQPAAAEDGAAGAR